MEWTLAVLFIISAVLLVFSILKSSHALKIEQKQVDQIHISTMKEINALQDSIRNLELDIEVVMEEAGIQLTVEEKQFRREVLDLFKRNYSVSSIADMKQVAVSQIEQILIPFKRGKDERRKVANEN